MWGCVAFHCKFNTFVKHLPSFSIAKYNCCMTLGKVQACPTITISFRAQRQQNLLGSDTIWQVIQLPHRLDQTLQTLGPYLPNMNIWKTFKDWRYRAIINNGSRVGVTPPDERRACIVHCMGGLNRWTWLDLTCSTHLKLNYNMKIKLQD